MFDYLPKDFSSNQDIKWCPGCGDYSILKNIQSTLPEIGVKKEDIVFVSGIGCSSRFPYYMDTFGVHGIHGRAFVIASGIKLSNDNLSVWVVSGDGDSLSIGGNHLIHLARRNYDINVLIFNNEIYGLTKGQFSPTSKLNQKTKSSPFGVKDNPFNPLKLLLGSGATFVARISDVDKRMKNILIEAQKHKGTSFVEIYQNCNVFNDRAFDIYNDKEVRDENTVFLEKDKPIIFGKDREKAIILEGYTPKIVYLSEISQDKLWIHDPKDEIKSFILMNMFDDSLPRPFGVIYSKDTEKKHRVNNSYEIENILKGDSYWSVL